jgi:plastocyanin
VFTSLQGALVSVTRLLGCLLLSALLAAAGPLAAQSLLDRPPNVSGDWIAPRGTVQFNFLHRFVRSDAPERKITNFPTFVIGVGLPRHTQVGFLYSTNSTLAPDYPNEWEFYGRWLPVSQEGGAPLDLGGQVGYNLAVKGLDGEISIARALGRLRLIGVTRILDDPQGGNADVALGGGLVLRLHRYIALAGDLVTLTHRDSALGEKPAWSAGVHVALPGTPHTLSIQATNTNTATLEGASRGTSQRRYGFEFTIPFTLARYFGRRQPAPPPPPPSAAPPAPGDTSAAARTGPTVNAGMKSLAFQPSRIEIAVGTTVVWTNGDQVQHTVTAVDRSFDSGNMAPGATWRYTFTKPGTYPFFCVVHPFMKGVVVVKEGK